MTKYEEVSGWADAIAEVVQQRRMPPWLADPKYGHFANDRSMPERGKSRSFTSGPPPVLRKATPRNLPRRAEVRRGLVSCPKLPDAVSLRHDGRAYSVPATGVVDYQYFAVDPGFKEDKWINAIEARPSNRAIVHHIIVFAAAEGRPRRRPPAVPGRLRSGRDAAVLPKGYAKMIPAGSELLFQMHFTPNGKPGDDISECGLVFADPKEVTHLVRTVEAINTGFEIPAGADNYKVEATLVRHPV